MSPFLAEIFYLECNLYELRMEVTEPIENYQVFVTYKSQVGERVKVAEGCTNSITFKYEKKVDFNPVFEIEFDSGYSIKSQIRILPIEGMFNFRDLGGYPSLSNRVVSWGKLFRGDHLFNLEEDGQSYIESLDLQAIIDLRTEQEQVKFPNRSISTVKKTYMFDPDGHIAVFAGALQNNEVHQIHDMFASLNNIENLNPENAVQAMVDQQKNFVTNPKSNETFRSLIRTLASDENVPNFHHCKGGKDRTGFASMLILGLLNVSREHIVYDYMLTKQARAKKNQVYYQKFLESSKSERVANYLYSLFDTKEEFILAAYDSIIETYGSITSYCMQVLNITEDEIANLQRIYTEPFVI